MLIQLREHKLNKWILYLVLINFINLSANFYESSESNSKLLINYDPLDSLSELMLEYFFEMDEDTIPDTEIPTEERSFLDLKLIAPNQDWIYAFNLSRISEPEMIFYIGLIGNFTRDIVPPPPKFWI
jgi:hypothetical protein